MLVVFSSGEDEGVYFVRDRCITADLLQPPNSRRLLSRAYPVIRQYFYGLITPCCVAAASTGDGGGDSPPPRSVLSPYLRRSDDWLILANILAVVSFGITQYFAEAERKRKGDPDAPPEIRRKKREIEEKQPEGLMMNSIPDCCTDITSNHLPWRPYLTQKEQHTPQGETVFNFFDNRQGSHVAAAHEPTVDENQSSTAVEEILKCQYCDNFTV
ncbi:hypothetical protein FOZ63_033782, partial [Perkinsus olseni]